MPDMELGDVTIHYEEAGDGPVTFVFCHGLGGSGEGFEQDDMGWYAEHFRTISWDNRGLGRSGQAAKYSLPLYASDLDRLLDKLDVEQAVIFGVSWGGVLVQRFALDFPERCAAIVVDSSSAEVNTLSSDNWYQRGEVAQRGADAIAGRTLEPAFAGHVTVSADSGRQVAPEHMESYVAESRAVAGLREHPMTPYLHSIECPALIVAGGQDATAGAGGSVHMARAIGDNARLEIVQESGHGVYRQARDEFQPLLLDFLADNGIN
ncbi:MAG TPA: alpha/beta hydrolase [Dehalococcoidia bacterium]|nr:alpha/beta hydrolase [Dehalococcoidia bacterium]